MIKRKHLYEKRCLFVLVFYSLFVRHNIVKLQTDWNKRANLLNIVEGSLNYWM